MNMSIRHITTDKFCEGNLEGIRQNYRHHNANKKHGGRIGRIVFTEHDQTHYTQPEEKSKRINRID